MPRAILITRAQEQGERSAERFAAAGYDVVHIPCIELVAPPDPAAFARAAAQVAMYDWVVLTSQNAVARLAEHAAVLPKIAAIGTETARAVEHAFGRAPDLVPGSHRGEALAAELLAALGPAPQRVVLYRAARGRSVLPDALAAAGHRLDLVIAYAVEPAYSQRTRLADWLAAHAADAPAATIVFASSGTVDSFFVLAPPQLPRTYRFACISPVTAEALLAHGVTAAVTAQEHTMGGLFRALSAARSDVN